MRVPVSVCMATYNGEPFLREQLDSILDQLNPADEVVVVDDCSRDGTWALLESLRDPRVRIVRNAANAGAEASFDGAIALARNPVIVMADQDDVWVPGRLDAMADALAASGKLMVSSNSEFIDAAGRPIDFPIPPLRAADSRRHVRNTVAIFAGRASYYGCAMAFRAELRSLVSPIPSYVESHDLWIALAGNLVRSNIHLESATLRRRIHGNNASVVQRPLAAKLWARTLLALSLAHLSLRWIRTRPMRRVGAAG